MRRSLGIGPWKDRKKSGKEGRGATGRKFGRNPVKDKDTRGFDRTRNTRVRCRGETTGDGVGTVEALDTKTLCRGQVSSSKPNTLTVNHAPHTRAIAGDVSKRQTLRLQEGIQQFVMKVLTLN